MVDLRDLRTRLAGQDTLLLGRGEALELLAELESGRALLRLAADGESATWQVQSQLVAQLLLNLAQGVSDDAEAQAVAAVVIHEVAGIARHQVRAEGR